MKEYQKKDIAKILNKPPRKLEFLVDSGVVVPDIERSPGKGRARIFSESNLIQFAMIEDLQKKCSMSLGHIGALFDKIKIYHPDFFYDDKWGAEKELVFISQFRVGHNALIPFEKNKDDEFDILKNYLKKFKPFFEFGYFVVYLGSIKNRVKSKIAAH